MRQEIIKKNYCTFNELSPDRQKKEIENYRDINVNFHDWYDFIFEYFQEMLTILGFKDIKILYSGFWSQGDGACFEACFEVPENFKQWENRLKSLKDYAPCDEKLHDAAARLLSKESLNELIKEDINRLNLYHRGHYYHEYCMYLDENEDTFLEAARDIAQIIYRSLEQNYYDLTSDEQVKETILANDMEFLISEEIIGE